MILSVQQSLIIITVIIAGTVLTRALPFIIFPRNKEIPGFLLYLGEVIPYAAIGMLIIYCLKGVSLTSAPYGLPESIAVLIVVVLHLWKKNTLLSIGVGTLVYMLLVQNIFV